MVIRRPIRVYSNIGPQLAAKRPAVSSSRRRRSPRRPRPSRLLSPTQPTLSTAHLRPRALTHIRRVGIPPPTPANNARTSGETARRRLVAAGEVGGQVGAQGHQSTAAEGMARPSRRRCRRAEPSASGRGNLRPACAGQKLWPPISRGVVCLNSTRTGDKLMYCPTCFGHRPSSGTSCRCRAGRRALRSASPRRDVV